jgi:hypothetical protein
MMGRNMVKTAGVFVAISALAILLAFGRGAAQTKLSPADHPAVGSYFGEAIQVCASGVAPSACGLGAQPAGVLLMTPTLTADGLIIADDSLTLLPEPFGPHATAHGTWTPTSSTDFTAEYVFMTKTYPPPVGGFTASGARARWQATVSDPDTLNGWVNAYFLDPVPVRWQRLVLDTDFPVLPSEASGFITDPGPFVKDPNLCRSDRCAKVFKFTLKRIRP